MAGEEIGSVAGALYSTAIEVQLKNELSRKASLEQRGLAVITSSGALTTLLIAVFTLATGEDANISAVSARIALLVASACFLLAGLLGLATNTPRKYAFIKIESMQRMVTSELWEKPPIQAGRRIAENQVAQIDVARRINSRKASFLTSALILEVAGVGFLVMTLAIQILG